MKLISLLAEVSICAGNSKEKRHLPRSDTSSVHDRGRVKPVCKTSSETGLEKQIVRMLRAELHCNDIEPVVSKWRLGQRGHWSALDHRQDTYLSETAIHTSQRYFKCSKLYINAINTLQMMHYK
jgi:hypothetical protein